MKIKYASGQHKPYVLLACALIAGVGTILTLLSHAETFCDINPANDNTSISAALAGCADGTTIRFPANAAYSLPDTIFVKDRHDLVIDGRGSTFTITTQGNTKPLLPNGGKNGGNWLLLRGTNITLKNITAIGSFPLAGLPISLANESSQAGYAEWMSNFGIYGTNGAYLQDLTGKSPWGDTVTTGPDTYIDGSTPDYASNVYVQRVHANDTSRMCFGLTSGSNMWLEDSSCKNGWYGGTDEELDNPDQPMVGLHILRNTWDGFGLFAIDIPVSGSNIRDIEIRDNLVSTTSVLNQCGTSLLIGTWPDQTTTFKNVNITNNTIPAYGNAITVDHIEGGTIKDNKITILPGGPCATGPGQFPPPIDSKRSSGLAIDNNGPNAPGANITAAPAATPGPSPNPAPTPTPGPTPPPSGCPNPSGFAGTPGPSGSGRYDFTWSALAGATEYNIFYSLAPNPPVTLYTGPFTAASASAYGLNAGTQYTFAVRAKCGSIDSGNSNVLTIQLGTSQAPPAANTTPPAVAITAPTSSSTVSSTTNITVTATDNVSVTKTELYIDGHLAGTDVAAPYVYGWDTSTYANGSHSITAKAYDTAGNVGVSTAITVSVNNPMLPVKAADTNGDGKVDILDLRIIGQNWGLSNRTKAQGDLNGDGVVNIFDLRIIGQNWGL